MLSKFTEYLYQATVIVLLSFLVYVALTKQAHAAPEIYDSVTGEYLGNLSANKFDADSVNNSYVRYGSEYSPTSINNPYSKWGSPYSNQSVNNQFATNPPVIIHRRR